MTENEKWTIGHLLTWTSDYLKEHAIESPRLDAEVLLAHTCGCRRIDLYASYNELADERTRATFRQLVKQRVSGMPVAYLVGKREFYSLDFRVTPDVLIPRPETEHLVVAVLDRCREMKQTAPRIVDIGTGSGAIAVTLAKHLEQAKITAVDISAKALEIARHNAQQHQVADQIQFIESDLLRAVAADETFDVIVSNPPYISAAEMEGLAREVREHEPTTALLAGEQGTEVIEQIVVLSEHRLRPGGWLLLEISSMGHDAVCEIIGTARYLQYDSTINDLAGLPRVVQACRIS